MTPLTIAWLAALLPLFIERAAVQGYPATPFRVVCSSFAGAIRDAFAALQTADNPDILRLKRLIR